MIESDYLNYEPSGRALPHSIPNDTAIGNWETFVNYSSKTAQVTIYRQPLEGGLYRYFSRGKWYA